MHSYAIIILLISSASICLRPASIYGKSVNRYVTLLWTIFYPTTPCPSDFHTRSHEIHPIRMIQKILLLSSAESKQWISCQMIKRLAVHWLKYSMARRSRQRACQYFQNTYSDCSLVPLNGCSRKFTIASLMPRFLHVKPKAKPEEIDPFKKGNPSVDDEATASMISFRLVFPLEYYSNITMGLNAVRSIPNSTKAWWEVSEGRTNFKVTPACK